MISNLIFYLIIGLAFAAAVCSRRFREANILNATAESLALIRILSAAVTLGHVLGQGYPSLALVPRELAAEPSPSGWLFQIPAIDAWHRHPAFLHLLTWGTCLALVSAVLGWRSRTSTAAGSLGALILGGMARHYVGFGHQGLISPEVLLVLSLTPCGNAFSMDARRRAVRHPREVYGWSRMACWCLLALPYVDAALGKVRAGNLNWLQADNLRSWLYMDNLLEKGFNFDGGLRLLHAPDWVFSAFATFCVVVEFSALLLLFLPLARRIVPWLLIALHLGILLFQNIPFFDLMIMPLIFVDWSKWTARLTVPDASPAAAPAYRYQALVLASVLFVLAPWKHNIEIYPLTGWKMYAGAQLSGVTGYESVRAILASGRIIPFEPGAAISVLRFGYHRGILPAAFDPARSAAFGRLLEECASRHNRNAVPDDRITGFLIERKTWDFRTQRDDPNFGTVIDSAKFLMPAHAN